ncbi:MAG TPA: hypothetical protein VMV72_00720 [Verrucomicrobiae bacterium]|nr:hypothetical protein [Verrucomicrobiae bacterium]
MPNSPRTTDRGSHLHQNPFDGDRYDVDQFYRRMAAEQNLPLGIIGGLVGALLGAAVWAGLAIVTGFNFGAIAILIGFLVGHGVRFFGRGVTLGFPVAGAVLAVLGLVVGRLLTLSAVYSLRHGVNVSTAFLDLVSRPDATLRTLLRVTGPLDGLFYIVAICTAAKLSFRPALFNQD